MSHNNAPSFHTEIDPQHSSSLLTLLLALLLTSCSIGTTTGAATSAPTRVSTTTTVTGKAVRLQQIHMFNVSTGWAMTTSDPVNGNKHILHTTTGVAHWQEVTSAIGNHSSLLGASDFFDALTAWVAVGGFPVVVYHTHDGG